MQSKKDKLLQLGLLVTDNPGTKTAVIKLDDSSRLPAFYSQVLEKKGDNFVPVGHIKDLIGPVKEPWVVITKKVDKSLEKGAVFYYKKTSGKKKKKFRSKT
ncbi:MAG: hypothetical protein ACFFD4_22365 [Candidatus Odinarchaeota archaeon]